MTAPLASDFLTPGHTIGAAYAPEERLSGWVRLVVIGGLAVAAWGLVFGIYEALVWIGRAV